MLGLYIERDVRVGIHRTDLSLEDAYWTEDESRLVFIRVVLYGRTEGLVDARKCVLVMARRSGGEARIASERHRARF